MLTSGDLVALLAATPLLVSILLTGWSYVWQRRLDSPLPSLAHHALLVTQVGGVLWLWTGLWQPMALGALGLLYLLMGVGVAVLLHRHGRVACGCWGERSGTLRPGLAAFDFVMGVATVRLANIASPPSGPPRYAAFAVLIVSLLVVVLLIPEARFAYRGLALRADRYRSWLAGFPELEPRPIRQEE